jgi:hypothetical protein
MRHNQLYDNFSPLDYGPAQMHSFDANSSLYSEQINESEKSAWLQIMKTVGNYRIDCWVYTLCGLDRDGDAGYEIRGKV